MTIQQKRLVEPAHNIFCWGCRFPTTIRSGFIKSSMAAPSLREFRVGRNKIVHVFSPLVEFGLNRFPYFSAVLTGTVDLVTTTMGLFMCWPTCGNCQHVFRSADPSSSGGVPTAINATSASAMFSRSDVEKWRRFFCTLRATISSSPGS